MSLRNQVAIVGIGATELSKNSGVSTMTLAQRAIMAALQDAGVEPSQLDGLADHSNMSTEPISR